MGWIRWDCSIQDDDFLINDLSGDEFKAWTLFMLRVKSMGARGSVATTPTRNLARNWNVPVEAVDSMLTKAKGKITEQSGRWYVTNWKKYQEEYKHAEMDEKRQSKGPSPGKTEDTPDGTTITITNTVTNTKTRDRARPKNLEEIKAYMASVGIVDYVNEAEKFFNHYTANGWKVGKNPMVDWKACVRNWKKNVKQATNEAYLDTCKRCGGKVNNLKWHLANFCPGAKAEPTRESSNAVAEAVGELAKKWRV